MKPTAFLLALCLLGLLPASAQGARATTDTTFAPFWDTSYQLRIHIFNPDEQDERVKNAVLSLYATVNGLPQLRLRDSLYMMERVAFGYRDLDGDGVKDLLVLRMPVATYNRSWYLYLVDQKTKRLTRVKGFEKMMNPKYNWDKCYVEAIEGYDKLIIARDCLIRKDGTMLFITRKD